MELTKLANWRKLYKHSVVMLSRVTYFRGLGVPRGIYSLKRLLLIFSNLILDSRVDRGIPSLEAAPDGPYTRPPLSRKAASMISFSLAAGFRASSREVVGSLARGCRESQLSSTEKFSVSHRITDRSMMFCSSRMLPGQGYD